MPAVSTVPSFAEPVQEPTNDNAVSIPVQRKRNLSSAAIVGFLEASPQKTVMAKPKPGPKKRSHRPTIEPTITTSSVVDMPQTAPLIE